MDNAGVPQKEGEERRFRISASNLNLPNDLEQSLSGTKRSNLEYPRTLYSQNKGTYTMTIPTNNNKPQMT